MDIKQEPATADRGEALEKDRQACWNSVHAVARRVDTLQELLTDFMAAPTLTEFKEITASPERYVRINITKNTKGYSYETTVSITTTGDQEERDEELAMMLRAADVNARTEIALREQADGGKPS